MQLRKENPAKKEECSGGRRMQLRKKNAAEEVECS
jgi:hypothetical protein